MSLINCKFKQRAHFESGITQNLAGESMPCLVIF
jgi:hypothetical protein